MRMPKVRGALVPGIRDHAPESFRIGVPRNGKSAGPHGAEIWIIQHNRVAVYTRRPAISSIVLNVWSVYGAGWMGVWGALGGTEGIFFGRQRLKGTG